MSPSLRCGLLVWAAAHAAAAGAETLQVGARESVTVTVPGASAVFAVDPDIVEVSMAGDRVTLLGRRSGQTLVTVVTPSRTETLTVQVSAPAAPIRTAEGESARGTGSVEFGYDSATRRYGSGLDLPFGEGERQGRLRLYGIREEADAGEDATWALPAASLELTQPGRRLVLLDDLVNLSPLTLNYSTLRGAHLYQGGLELHAGVASTTPWSDLLLPSSGDRAASIAYRQDAGPVQLVPRLLWLPDSTAETPGVAALGLERGSASTPWWLKAELGWSDAPGFALDASYRGAERQVWLQGSTRPQEFAALNTARPAGRYLDGAWTEWFGARTSASLTYSANRLDLAERQPEASAGRLELRHQLTGRWSLTASMGSSRYDDGVAALNRRTGLLGAAYDTPAFGLATLYRHQQTDDGSPAGHGGRFTLRGAGGPWRANLFVDAQQQSPTLDLIFQGRPDLERAFAELGFTATTPEETLRLLRDNAALFAEQGIDIGEITLSPLRLQGGLNLAWREPGPRRPELGLRLLADRTEGSLSTRRTTLASVYGSWPLFRQSELTLSYVRWSAEHDGAAGDQRDSYQLTWRTRFAAARLPGGRRAIGGRVLRDEDGAGPGESGRPLAGIEVILDGGQSTRTDADGRFRFAATAPGEHRLQAVLPPEPGAYFTRPSAVTLPAGGEAEFTISFSAARVSGTVLSDTGLPLAGVTVRLQGPADATATTDSQGVFRLAGPPGFAQLTVVPESLPPGYDLRRLEPRALMLTKSTPAVANFRVRAQRVLRGQVKGTGGEPLAVLVPETALTVTPDQGGRFLLRNLPVGPLTFVVKNRYGQTRQVIDIPAEPGPLSIELTAPRPGR